VIETKKKIAILTVAVAALALTALISTVSAVPIGNHTITFVSHTYDPGTCISRWTYTVTSGSSPSLSHWVMEWCNKSALVKCSESCTYGPNQQNSKITGIKFNNGYSGGDTRTVWFELKGCGNYNEGDRKVGTKAGNGNVDYGSVTGPIGLSGDPCAPVPELPTIILLGAGLLTLAGYVGLRRKKK
jgi:LPXTG-motif cell wall-anchored protein